MPTTNGNRKLLDLKAWNFCTPSPSATVAGSLIISSRHFRQQQLLVTSTTVATLYNPSEDGWVQVPSPALAGTFAAGAAGVAGAFSTGTTVGASSLTATAGTTLSITTNQTIARDLRGYSVYFVGGTNAGKLKTIASNTIGTNAVITFDSAEATPFDATSQYRIKAPVFYLLGSGTLAAGSFRKYDFATNTWTTLAITGLPATIATDGRMVGTPAWIDTGFKSFATGTATAGGATTLTNSGKNWATNQWANSCQVRITGGTGTGQIRIISSNTATALTVSAAWTTNPDATSTYSIEGNDDYLYYMGNNAVTLYRYSIAGNTWTTLSPGVARAGAPGAGMGGSWINSVPAADWNVENLILNGRYIYSFRGGASAALDRYDIAANSWAALTYAPATETFTTGTKYAYNKDRIYLTKEATGRWFYFDIAEQAMHGWTTVLYTQGAAIVGDTAFDVTYKDGATEIEYIYFVMNTSTILYRQIVI